ncbi:MAG: hypothetical protein JSS02_11055 [Planctomycetes bacterium]|nr:hypothetical protein [Planctomycetota bacterium]
MSAQKKSSRHSPALKSIAVPDGAQSAAARRLADAEVRSLIEKFAPTRGRLVSSLRRALRQRMPTAHEVVYEYRDCVVISFSPSGNGYEGVLGLRASDQGIKLYFNRGQDLPDPARVLQGKGGQTRSLNVETIGTLARPEVAALIDMAIARNTVPFAKTGRGSVVIRSTTAQRRRQGDTT